MWQKRLTTPVTLTWTYDKFVSGFQLYRYYEFPDGSGSYRLEYVPFSKGVKKGDKYEFTYTDTSLSPYTEYKYQIQTESTSNPKVSIYSEPISCRTKTTVGYPQITVSGLVEDGKDAGKLAIYPDAEGKAVVAVAEEAKYKSLSYQWQKLVGGEWKNMPAYKTKELTIANASAATREPTDVESMPFTLMKPPRRSSPFPLIQMPLKPYIPRERRRWF